MAGKSIVTSRAIVDIVRTAVQSSYGVTGFSDPNVGRRVMRLVGVNRPGIKLSTGNGIRLDLFITVAFGVPVAEVARQVDSAVRYSLRHYIGAEVTSLNIHVDGLKLQPTSIERAEAIERTEAVEHAEADPGDRPRNQSAAAGATASRKRKPK